MKSLILNNLIKTYPNGIEALKGINLEVNDGDFFALLGPNGAGKTTAIGIISSLVNKTAGQVEIFGYSLDYDLESVKKSIGVVPQEFNMNDFDKVLNIVVNQAGYYGINRNDALINARKYLKELRLWDRRNESARNLSGGMKRRLMIARALVHEPKLLILDEPTAGVDIEIRRSMWRFLKRINEAGTTIILTTHYLEEAENLCRNIAIIDEGDIVENSTMRTLLNKLHREVLVLNLKKPLQVMPNLGRLETKLIDNHSLEVVLDKDDNLNELFEILSRQGITVTSMRNKANRLEELFIRLVESKTLEA